MSTQAQRALVLYEDAPAVRELRLVRLLDFFGVPAELRNLEEVSQNGSAVAGSTYALLAGVDTLATAVRDARAAAVVNGAVAVYAIAAGDCERTASALMALVPERQLLVVPGPLGDRRVEIAPTTLMGPMSGLVFTTMLAAGDVALATGQGGEHDASTLISVGGASLFSRFERQGVPMYFAGCVAPVDLDAPVAGNYYDVKRDVIAAITFVAFVRSTFASTMWQPRELGACLIIDDPLLKPRYGFCDFVRLGELMTRHGFTTNIAFIPWNWRRTSVGRSAIFRRDTQLFSVSIHGCDHIAAEFGATAIEALERSASIARLRMDRHRRRTQIEHDPVMVFPQGVFSSSCPEVLKQYGFVAAVNTEVGPSDTPAATTIGDVWDMAIARYGGFPIYTRRYAFHGVENFAFDMLLGKPCFIVAHHEFFNDRGARLVTLIEQLQGRGVELRWRSPLQAIRRAYRRRRVDGAEQITMYGSELLVENRSDGELRIQVRKQESTPQRVAGVDATGQRVDWDHSGGHMTFVASVPPRSEQLFAVSYVPPPSKARRPSMRYEISVAARRALSELRDEYFQKVRPGWQA